MDAAPLGVCAPNIVERHVQRLRVCIAKVARGASRVPEFPSSRVPGSVNDWRRLLCCSSRVMGNYHARFLGGWARATAPGYPPPAAKSEERAGALQSGARTRRKISRNASIAVGMPVTRHPPHRSERAQFAHSAPTSGA